MDRAAREGRCSVSQIMPNPVAPPIDTEALEQDARATAVAQRIIARRDPLRTQARHDPFLRLLLAEAYLEGLADGSRERGQ